MKCEKCGNEYEGENCPVCEKERKENFRVKKGRGLGWIKFLRFTSWLVFIISALVSVASSLLAGAGRLSDYIPTFTAEPSPLLSVSMCGIGFLVSFLFIGIVSVRLDSAENLYSAAENTAKTTEIICGK